MDSIAHVIKLFTHHVLPVAMYGLINHYSPAQAGGATSTMSRHTRQNVTIGAASHVDTCDLPSSFAVFRKKQSTKKFEELSNKNEIVINGRKLPDLCTFLDDSRRKSLFTLVGSPGIGKSTLIKQLLNDIQKAPVLHTIDTVLFFNLRRFVSK